MQNAENNYFPAEWATQDAIQLTWPDKETDWADQLDEVIALYQIIAREILKHERLLIVCRNKMELPDSLRSVSSNIIIREIPLNDTWARDHGALTIKKNGQLTLLNFQFNGWGLKFPACYDNQINTELFSQSTFNRAIRIENHPGFTLEGGSIESNGHGCILTTEQCLLSKNRNEQFSKQEIELFLLETFQSEKILWLKHGYLEGDDTDSHIDTLARFCTPNTIAYVKCDQPNDPHFEELRKMEKELQQLTDQNGKAFRLVALPWPDPIYEEGERLPATYANFLILNNAVLLPIYGVKQDKKAIKILSSLFPEREIVPINSIPLIRQHGSIHCITMQFPQHILSE